MFFIVIVFGGVFAAEGVRHFNSRARQAYGIGYERGRQGVPRQSNPSEIPGPWAEGARKAAAQHMTGCRWSARLKSGIRPEPFLLMDANYIDAVLSRPCVGQESDNLRVRACGDRFPRQGILPG